MESVTSNHLVKVYREGIEALKGIDIAVMRGELFTLLGPNGAGKTTFLRIISTQLMPTRGDAFVLGHSVLDEPAKVREHIAVVPQDVAAYGNYTPLDYAYYFAILRGMSRGDAKEAAKEALEAVDLWDLRDRTCSTLSGGEKKRAIIASALASQAEVLMLDEPTSGLDAIARRRVWSALRGLVKEGKTILLTTHMMEEAEMVSDRLAIINEGDLVAVGRLDEVKGLVKERFRVVVAGDLDLLSSYGEVVRLGDKRIVYLAEEGQALELVRIALKVGVKAEVSPVTLEDVFVKLVGGIEQ